MAVAEKLGRTSTSSWHYGTDYLQRALIAYIGAGGNLPADAFYPIARFDGDGKVLNGASRYMMHFTKADIPPIHPQGFWSLTMYDKEYFLVANSINRYSLSSRGEFQNNPDGSMDSYIQKESPGADKQANWLRAPDGEFILMPRLYWPKDEAVDGAWAPRPLVVWIKVLEARRECPLVGPGCVKTRIFQDG
jgi:hypothetical protein